MTILIFIIGLSLLILIHELGHFLAAKYFGLLVEEFGFGFPPRLFSKKIGETIYSLNILPFGGFVKIHGEKRELQGIEANPERSFWFLSVWRRIMIVVAGIAMNFFLGWLIISSVYMIGAPSQVVITGVASGSPAEAVGLKSGDVIIGYENTADFISFVKDKAGTEVQFQVQRGEDKLDVSAVPREDPPPGEGALGIALNESGFKKQPFFKSLGQGFLSSLEIIWGIFAAVGSLFRNLFVGAPVGDGFVGPVGIFKVANEAASFGLAYLLRLIGLISLNLVVLNILPVPALDGGRVFFLLIEKVKGSPLSLKKELIANAIGFSVMVILMILITVRDIAKIFF